MTVELTPSGFAIGKCLGVLLRQETTTNAMKTWAGYTADSGKIPVGLPWRGFARAWAHAGSPRSYASAIREPKEKTTSNHATFCAFTVNCARYYAEG